MPSRAATEYRYEKLTWPEINDAVEMGKVCVVPVGAVEQHGHHLPLDVDLVCPNGVATGAGGVSSGAPSPPVPSDICASTSGWSASRVAVSTSDSAIARLRRASGCWGAPRSAPRYASAAARSSLRAR